MDKQHDFLTKCSLISDVVSGVLLIPLVARVRWWENFADAEHLFCWHVFAMRLSGGLCSVGGGTGDFLSHVAAFFGWGVLSTGVVFSLKSRVQRGDHRLTEAVWSNVGEVSVVISIRVEKERRGNRYTRSYAAQAQTLSPRSLPMC